MINLFVNSLIPPYFLSFQKTLALPPIPLQSPAQIIDRAERPADAGIFSALSSYVSSFANDEPPEPSDQEIEYTLCTVDTVKECHFDDILANISQLPVESLRSLLMSLLEQIPEDGSPRVIVVKPEMPPAISPRSNGNKMKLSRPAYDPSLVFVLELATVLAVRDEETVKELAKDVADALASVIRNASQLHPVVTARSVYYLLSLLKASNVSHKSTARGGDSKLTKTPGLRLPPRPHSPPHLLFLPRRPPQAMRGPPLEGPRRLLQRPQWPAHRARQLPRFLGHSQHPA